VADDPALDAEALLRTLDQFGVRYVVIGGVATLLHGDTAFTRDLDITPATSRANLGRLARALRSISAVVRAGDELIEWQLDDRAFDSFTTMTLRTDHGDIDVVLRPDAPKPARYFDFERLDERAVEYEVAGLRVRVAALDDVIASKQAAGRPKDLAALGRLVRLRERLQTMDE
jgi:hypothetical protein